MRRLPLLAVALIALGTASAWAAPEGPRPGVWVIKGAHGTTGQLWDATVLLSRADTGCAGYFDWKSRDGKTSDRELFEGAWDPATGKLTLRSRSDKGQIGRTTYTASVAEGGSRVVNGKWVGTPDAPGQWEASFAQAAPVGWTIGLDPAIGIWTIRGARGRTGKVWDGRMVLRRSGPKFTGYFQWAAQGAKLGDKEYFEGAYNRETRVLTVRSNQSVSATAKEVLYVVVLDNSGVRLKDGKWEGTPDSPGQWSAVFAGPEPKE